MILTGDEVLARVEKPLNSDSIEKGRKYESRLRLFTEVRFKDDLKSDSAWKEFEGFMRTVLKDNKSSRILEFMQYPLSGISITDSLLNDIYKVFEAGNSYFNVYSVKKNGGVKIDEVMIDLDILNWVNKNGKEALKNKPNKVVVIDKDEDGKPYLLSVDGDRVVDIKLKENSPECEYIVFIHSEKEGEIRYSVYDDESYHVVLDKKGKVSLETSVKHGSNKCPARMFLSEKLNSDSKYSRKAPLALVLSKLNEWQYFDLYKFYTDHYAPFPVTEMIRAKCSAPNCTDGWIHTEDNDFAGGVTTVVNNSIKCKVCEDNNQVGIGARILLDPPEDDKANKGAGVFRMISNDTKNLTYLKDKLLEIENYIKMKVVGIDNLVSREAINEKQVQGSFESRTNVLLNIKTNLDELYKWIAKTAVYVTVGADKPLEVSANFGTEWYLISEDDLQERFKKAVEIGLPKGEIDMIYNQIIETKYKGNQEKARRMKLIHSLNPVPYTSVDNKVVLMNLGIISKRDLIISERIITFVKMFEMNEGDILQFGENLDEVKKHLKITEILNKYADEQIRESTTKPIEAGD